MSFQFTELQLQEIERLYAEADTQLGVGQPNYSNVYAYIKYELITFGLLTDQNQRQVLSWFVGATQANAGDGIFSVLIREYTNQQAVLRIGTAFSPEVMQCVAPISDSVIGGM